MGQHNDEPALIDGLDRNSSNGSGMQMLQWHLSGDCPARTEADINEKENRKLEAGKVSGSGDCRLV